MPKPCLNDIAVARVAVLLALGAAQVSGHAAAAPQFAALDADGNGRIERTEAGSVHGLRELFPHYDRNGDGSLDAAEFQSMILDAAEATSTLKSDTAAPGDEAEPRAEAVTAEPPAPTGPPDGDPHAPENPLRSQR